MTHVLEVQKQGSDFSLFNFSQLHASNDCLIKVTNFVDYQKKKMNLIVEILVTTKGFYTELHLHKSLYSFNNLPSKKSIVFFLPKTRKINIKDEGNSY